MPDLETRFRGLDGVRGPDLWPDIETREPRPLPEGGTTRRVAVAAVALTLAAGGAVLVARAFLGADQAVERRVRPAESPPAPVDPVVDVTLPIEWPSSIVYGEGSIWVAAWVEETDGNLLYRIHPDTGAIQAEIPVPSIPGWETGGGGMVAVNGSVWIAGLTEDERQAALLRVDARTNELADVVPLGGDFAGDVALDEHGIWVTVFGEPSAELVRLDPQTLIVESRIDLDSDWVREILALEGTVWVRVVAEGAEDVGDRKRFLLRIDPDTGEVVQRVEAPGAVTAVTAGGGAIWATAWRVTSGNALARLDPATGVVTLVPSDTLDYLVEFGEGGLWGRGLVDQATGRLGIVRFDPVTRLIDTRVRLDRRQEPIDLALAPGSVWVASYDEGVTRIELRPQ